MGKGKIALIKESSKTKKTPFLSNQLYAFPFHPEASRVQL